MKKVFRTVSLCFLLSITFSPNVSFASARNNLSTELNTEEVADEVLDMLTTLDEAFDQVAKEKEEEERKKEEERKAKEKRKKEEAKKQVNLSASGNTSGNKVIQSKTWDGSVLTKSKGVNYGPNGKETYYNLPMQGVINIMRRMGNTDEYWVREDGAKMLGDYIMVAANLNVFPRGSIVETSMGLAIVCDTGGFAASNPTQLDIAVSW